MVNIIMFPSYIEQLVYVACVDVVYGYTLHSIKYTQVCMMCMHYCHQTVLHVFNRTCSTVILAV